jgi:hypothetical protein
MRTKHPSFLVLLLFVLLLPIGYTSCSKEASIRQKQIDRERKKNERKARKAYKMDLKKHLKNQSKETRAMMRKSRRNSRKNTPLK